MLFVNWKYSFSLQCEIVKVLCVSNQMQWLMIHGPFGFQRILLSNVENREMFAYYHTMSENHTKFLHELSKCPIKNWPVCNFHLHFTEVWIRKSKVGWIQMLTCSLLSISLRQRRRMIIFHVIFQQNYFLNLWNMSILDWIYIYIEAM